jgi:hypothetical protein
LYPFAEGAAAAGAAAAGAAAGVAADAPAADAAAAPGASVGSAVVAGTLVAPAAVACVSTINTLLSGIPVIDSHRPVAGDLVLLTGQTTASQNGLWTVTATGVWTRPPGFAAGATTGPLAVAVVSGTQFGGSTWLLSTNAASPVIVGTSAQTWVEQLPSSVVQAPNMVPELEITQVVNTSRLGSTVTVMDRDPRTGTAASVPGAALQATPAPVLWGAHENIVLTSTDDGLSWAQTATISAYTTIAFLKVLADGTILIVATNSVSGSAPYDILSSSNGGQTFTPVASQPFTRTAPYSRLLGNLSWFQRANGDLYLCEYGLGPFPGGARIMKSSNKGQTWTTVTTFIGATGAFTDQVRHLHSVFEDPYVSGRLWVCSGDAGNNGVQGHSRIGYSDDMGTTWTFVTRMTLDGVTDGSYRRSRAVGLMFTSAAVFWFADVPEQIAAVYRYDRATAEVIRVTGPWPNSGQVFAASFTLPDGTPMLLTTLSVEPVYQINRDDIGRILASADGGATWHEVFNWKRTQLDQVSGLFPAYFTQPDANGEFWLTLQNADGSEPTADQINFKFRAWHRNAGDRPRDFANHRERFELAAAAQAITIIHPETFGGGANQSIGPVALWQAPADLIVVAFDIICQSTVPASSTDYWTPTLSVIRGGSETAGIIGEAGGPGVAITPNTPIATLSAGGLLWANAGDWVALGAPRTGAPANMVGLTAWLSVRRANVII